MFILGGILVLFVIVQSSLCGNLNDEYSVGTNVNKYLYSKPDGGIDEPKRSSGKQTEIWYGPRFGKRSQAWMDELPVEFKEFLDKVDQTPELQKLMFERLVEESPYDGYYIPKFQQRSQKVFAPRYGRDSPDITQNLNSRPYPPRFGRQSNNLPPYLPRLGRSAY